MAKTPFSARLNYHRNLINNPKPIRFCSYFRKHSNYFKKHSKFIAIERLKNTSNSSKDTLKLKLKRR